MASCTECENGGRRAALGFESRKKLITVYSRSEKLTSYVHVQFNSSYSSKSLDGKEYSNSPIKTLSDRRAAPFRKKMAKRLSRMNWHVFQIWQVMFYNAKCCGIRIIFIGIWTLFSKVNWLQNIVFFSVITNILKTILRFCYTTCKFGRPRIFADSLTISYRNYFHKCNLSMRYFHCIRDCFNTYVCRMFHKWDRMYSFLVCTFSFLVVISWCGGIYRDVNCMWGKTDTRTFKKIAKNILRMDNQMKTIYIFSLS